MEISKYLRKIIETEDEIKDLSSILMEKAYNDSFDDIFLYQIKILKYNKIKIKDLEINNNKKDFLDNRTFYVGIDKNDTHYPYILIFNLYNILYDDNDIMADTILYFKNFQILLFYIKFIISTCFTINSYTHNDELYTDFLVNIEDIYYNSLDTYDIYHIDKFEALQHNITYFYKTLSKFKFRNFIKEDIKILSENNKNNEINSIYTLTNHDEAEKEILFNTNNLFFDENGLPYILNTPDFYIIKCMLLQLKERGFEFDVQATLDSYRNKMILNLQKLI